MSGATYEGCTQAAFDECVAYYADLGYVLGMTEDGGDCVRMYLPSENASADVEPWLLAPWVVIWKKPLSTGTGFKVLREEY